MTPYLIVTEKVCKIKDNYLKSPTFDYSEIRNIKFEQLKLHVFLLFFFDIIY